MLYAADLFFVPSSPRNKGTKGFVNKLARVQRMAGLYITGAIRSIPTDSLDAHADLLPFPLLVNKVVHQSAIRLAMLPASHPLHEPVKRAATRYVKHHRSPLGLSS
jgi:hypothetical protein